MCIRDSLDVALELTGNAYMAGTLNFALDGQIRGDYRFPRRSIRSAHGCRLMRDNRFSRRWSRCRRFETCGFSSLWGRGGVFPNSHATALLGGGLSRLAPLCKDFLHEYGNFMRQAADFEKTYILNTPNRVRSSIGALSDADNPSPSTRRVSAGSMMPSSHSRAVA